MRPISILAAIGLCLPALAQSGRIQNGSASFKNGLGFAYETRLEPPIPSITGEKFGGGVNVDEGIHRFLVDRSRHVYFGYDIAIDRLAEPTAYRVCRKTSLLQRSGQLEHPAVTVAWVSRSADLTQRRRDGARSHDQYRNRTKNRRLPHDPGTTADRNVRVRSAAPVFLYPRNAARLHR
jgi:hypothetical protein